MIKIDNSKDRKEVMENYEAGRYDGKNQDGETIILNFDKEGMEVTTYQSNHWIRINYFDKDGLPEGETFNGRWED